jgi:hypothetical protein
MDNKGTPGGGTPDYAQALAMALERRQGELADRGRRWRREAAAALDRLHKTATECLEGEPAAAAQLQIEMQRDLLDYMPDPMTLPSETDAPELNPREPERVRDDIVATARFIEWLLFRKCSVPAQEIAGLFDLTDLSRQTVSYGRLLQVVENDAKSMLKVAPLPGSPSAGHESRSSSPVSHLRLV